MLKYIMYNQHQLLITLARLPSDIKITPSNVLNIFHYVLLLEMYKIFLNVLETQNCAVTKEALSIEVDNTTFPARKIL